MQPSTTQGTSDLDCHNRPPCTRGAVASKSLVECITCDNQTYPNITPCFPGLTGSGNDKDRTLGDGAIEREQRTVK